MACFVRPLRLAQVLACELTPMSICLDLISMPCYTARIEPQRDSHGMEIVSTCFDHFKPLSLSLDVYL